MHSSIEKILLAAQRLPAHLRDVFDRYYMDGMEPGQVCERLEITREEFDKRLVQLNYEMRAVAA